MKKFFTSVICAAVFFVGLGGLVERTGATYKSDEKALELLRKARQAIGGESAVSNVKSMTIAGKATKTFELEGGTRTEQGEMEINFELPNKMSKMLKIGKTDALTDQFIDKKVDVIVVKKGDGDNVQLKTESNDAIKVDGVKKVILKKEDGTEEVITEDIKPIIVRKTDGTASTWTSEDGKTIDVDGKNVIIRKNDGAVTGDGDNHQQFELLRTTLSLLLTAPEGLDVSYVYAGEANVDGFAVDIIDAKVGKSGVKLFLDKTSHLPRMISWQGFKPLMIFTIKKDDSKPEANGETKIFTRKLEAPETAEFQVKYSDYRSVNGLQLPFKWTQTIGGKADETIDITGYEINPANISDKFKEIPTKVLVRTTKQQ